MRNRSRILSLLALALLVASEPAAAQRRGGGSRGGGMRGGGGMRSSGGMPRSSARPSVTQRPSSRPASRPNIGAGAGQRPPNIGSGIGSNANRGATNAVNRDNISRGDVSRAIDNRNLSSSDIAGIRNNNNINRPVVGNDININNGGNWDGNYNGCCYHPVAAAVGVAAGAAITAAAIGSMVYALPPDCIVSTINYTTYNHCGSVWYEPQFDGTNTTYIVVEPPQ